MVISFPLVIELAGKPKGQARAHPRAIVIGGQAKIVGKFTKKETRIYEASLKMAGQAAMKGAAPLQGALVADIVAVMPIAPSWPKKKQEAARAGTELPCVKPDHDNLAKSLDGLNQIVWVDDKQVIVSRVFKIYGDRPCLRVIVRQPTLDDFAEAHRLLAV